MTARTYTTEAERTRALEAAREDYARTGVFTPPVPATLAAHEATRYPRLPGTAPLAPAPAPAAVTGEQVAEVIREAVAMVDDAAAQSFTARRLRELGADPVHAMGRVQAEREAAAVRDTAAVRPARRDPGFLR
jgi:hypothetical protein